LASIAGNSSTPGWSGGRILGHLAQLGVDRRQLVDAGEQRRPAEGTRRAHALEAIDDLEPVRLDEQRQRGELPVLLEGAAHRGERIGIAQAQRGQALAQAGDLDQARRGGGGWQLHAGTSSTVGRPRRRLMRDHAARKSAESRGLGGTCAPRVLRDRPGGGARLRGVSSERDSEIVHEGGA
jgi:hypothetical protein